MTVSLEAKNSDAAQTSVIDYCNIYLQIGTKSIAVIEVARITGLESLRFDLTNVYCAVWDGAVDTATISLHDEIGSTLLYEAGTTINKFKYDLSLEMMIGVVTSYILVKAKTNDATNPVVLKALKYNRVWFE